MVIAKINVPVKVTKYFVLSLVFLLLFLPLVALLMTSFKPDDDLLYNVASLFPSKFTFKNYYKVFNLSGDIELNFFRAIGNTVIITVCSVVGTVFSSAICAYGFTRFNAKFKPLVFAIFMAGSFVPGQVLQIPIYRVYRELGFINTFLPFIIPPFLGGGIFNIFLVQQFMRGIPKTMFEAGEIDGASDFRMFLKFMLPLCVPVLLTIGIFTFLGAWNDFAGPLIYLQKEEMFTLALAVYQFMAEFNRYTGSSSSNTPWNMIAAVNVISMIPVLVIFAFGQRYFMEGIALGSVKG